VGELGDLIIEKLATIDLEGGA